MKYTLHITLIFIFLVEMLSAQTAPTKGLKKYNEGEFWYKLYSKNRRQPKPQVGDQVHIDYTLGKEHQVLQQSYKSRHPTLVQIPPQGYDNFFTRALCLMGVGDSLLVRMPADSIQAYLGEFQPQFMRGEWVTFTYKMHKIKDASIYQAEQIRQKNYMDSIRMATYKWVREYQKDSIESLSDWDISATDLRYKIHQKGSDNKACKGTFVQLHILAFLPDASIMFDSFEAMQPVDWEVGSFTMIQGVSEAICMLGEGGSASLFVPSKLGYGKLGVPDMVPPYSNLIFYIEITKVN